METDNNAQFTYAVNTQPQYTVEPPESNCCSRCWQAIFHCSTSTPSLKQRKIEPTEPHQETIDPPLIHPSVGSAFPADFLKEVDDVTDGSTSEISEGKEDRFIRGY
nr:hypothetical protein HmN_000311400 [Hymenolepis microstoma]